jgi:hypothetical protein
MENITNLKIRRFTESIANIINESDLPIELMRLSLYMIYTETQRTADNAVSREINIEEESHLQEIMSGNNSYTVELTQEKLNKGSDANAESPQ